MIFDWEATQGRTIDWIVVARMDCVYVVDIPPLSPLPSDTLNAPYWDSFGGINDRFAILPRNKSHLYTHLYRSAVRWGPCSMRPGGRMRVAVAVIDGSKITWPLLGAVSNNRRRVASVWGQHPRSSAHP